MENNHELFLYLMSSVLLGYLLKYINSRNGIQISIFNDHHKDLINFIKVIKMQKSFIIKVIYSIILTCYSISILLFLSQMIKFIDV